MEFHMRCSLSKTWSSADVEQEIFKRLNKAKFDIKPSEDWGFLDRRLHAKFDDDVCVLIYLLEGKHY